VREKFPKGVWGNVGRSRHVLEHSGVICSSFGGPSYIVAKAKNLIFGDLCEM
jgi:hypothetical protein